MTVYCSLHSNHNVYLILFDLFVILRGFLWFLFQSFREQRCLCISGISLLLGRIIGGAHGTLNVDLVLKTALTASEMSQILWATVTQCQNVPHSTMIMMHYDYELVT